MGRPPNRTAAKRLLSRMWEPQEEKKGIVPVAMPGSSACSPVTGLAIRRVACASAVASHPSVEPSTTWPRIAGSGARPVPV